MRYGSCEFDSAQDVPQVAHWPVRFRPRDRRRSTTQVASAPAPAIAATARTSTHDSLSEHTYDSGLTDLLFCCGRETNQVRRSVA